MHTTCDGKTDLPTYRPPNHFSALVGGGPGYAVEPGACAPYPAGPFYKSYSQYRLVRLAKFGSVPL
jgi:hypothetical protein